MNWYHIVKYAQSTEPLAYVRLFNASSNSNGSHGYDDYPEIPADDCSKNVQWELNFLQFPPEIESILKNEKLLIEDHSFHSYHECQVAIYAQVFIFNPQTVQKLQSLKLDSNIFYEFNKFNEENDRFYKSYSYEKLTYSRNQDEATPFVSYKNAIEKAIHTKDGIINPPPEFPTQQLQTNQYAPENEESSEEYWTRLINKEKAKNPTYKDGD